MTDEKAPTLYDAVSNFLGPICAEYARLIDEWPSDMPVLIQFGGYNYKTTLDDFKKLSRAHQSAFDAKVKRSEKRAKGTLL